MLTIWRIIYRYRWSAGCAGLIIGWANMFNSRFMENLIKADIAWLYAFMLLSATTVYIASFISDASASGHVFEILEEILMKIKMPKYTDSKHASKQALMAQRMPARIYKDKKKEQSRRSCRKSANADFNRG